MRVSNKFKRIWFLCMVLSLLLVFLYGITLQYEYVTYRNNVVGRNSILKDMPLARGLPALLYEIEGILGDNHSKYAQAYDALHLRPGVDGVQNSRKNGYVCFSYFTDVEVDSILGRNAVAK